MPKVYAYTDIGKRQTNQDTYWIANIEVSTDVPDSPSEGAIICVCDGMGGLADGKHASSTTLTYLRETVLSKGIDKDSIMSSLEDANHKLYLEGKSRGERMGTTCTLLILLEGEYMLYHVGDSRCYKIRRDNVYKILTKDQTAYERGIKNGEITLLDNKNLLFKGKQYPISRLKSTLTNCIGVSDNLAVDIDEGRYSNGEIFLISSDGFWHGLEQDVNWPLRLRRSGDNTEEYLQNLAQRMLSGTEKDNLTAVVVSL